MIAMQFPQWQRHLTHSHVETRSVQVMRGGSALAVKVRADGAEEVSPAVACDALVRSKAA